VTLDRIRLGISHLQQECILVAPGERPRLSEPFDVLLLRSQRESNEPPRLNAFCRVAPRLRLSDLAIFGAGLFGLAIVFSSRTSSLVHSRRLDAFSSRSRCLFSSRSRPCSRSRPAGSGKHVPGRARGCEMASRGQARCKMKRSRTVRPAGYVDAAGCGDEVPSLFDAESFFEMRSGEAVSVRARCFVCRTPAS
jgi:hypothetical protein